MGKKITSFEQFSRIRRVLLKFGFDIKTVPSEAQELFLLSSLLGVIAADLGVPLGPPTKEREGAILAQARASSVSNQVNLQSRVKEELAHRRQALGAFVAVASLVVAIASAIAASNAAKSSSRSAATAQAAVNIILNK